MALEAEQAVSQRIVALFLQQGNRQEFPLGLGHLAACGVQMVHMEPGLAPLMAEVRLGLGDLVGMMGEGIVDAAAVEVEVFAQVLLGDAGALDMPARIAHAPGRIPLERLILKLRFGEPQHEVSLVALVLVRLHIVTDAHRQVFLVVIVENVVLFQLGGIKIDVAAGTVGVALCQQFFDHLDIFIDAVGGGLDHVGRFDVELCTVGKERVGVEPGDFHHRLVLTLGALEHLVLAGVRVGSQMAHVGDVHHALDVVAFVAQGLFQHILHDIGTQIANVGKMVYRRAAGVHAHILAEAGREDFLAVRQGIIQEHIGHPFGDGIGLFYHHLQRKSNRAFHVGAEPEGHEIEPTAGQEHEGHRTHPR